MKDRSDDLSLYERTLARRYNLEYLSVYYVHYAHYLFFYLITDARRIDPSQWTQLQFGLFSVPTSGPQLVYQRPWYVLFCLWKCAYKRSLAAYRKE